MIGAVDAAHERYLAGGPDTQGDAWTGMWAPVQTPKTEIARVQAALKTILAAPQARQTLMSQLAVVPDYLDGEQMARRQRAELETWGPIIRASGFRAEL